MTALQSIEIRPSARPRFVLCPSSVVPPLHPIDRPHEARALGSAVHESLAIVAQSPGAVFDLKGVAIRHGCSFADLEKLHRVGAAVLRELRPYFTGGVIESERALSGPLGEGTADLVVIDHLEGVAIVVDWKSGRGYSDAHQQLLAYAGGVFDTHPTMGEVKAIQIDLQHGSYDVTVITPSEVAAEVERDKERRAQIGETHNPGAHCGYCPRRYECEARSGWMRSVSHSLPNSMVEATAGGELLTPSRAAELYPVVKAIESAIADYRAALRVLVDEHGPIELGDGREVYAQTKTLTDIGAREAWPVMAEALSQDEIASVISVGKGKLVAAVRDKAPRGKKKSAEENLLTRLDEAGAITERKIQSLGVRKATPKLGGSK